ncbi:GNAT family N-acetyltransferase [Nocardiopsis chromatogenes]|uniref:GNAT family N-acetyltransferase n=1 Tax=Nocardiopsis chromatogenes TaxID=280239 RepID=UPI0003448E85|nr:GNAT family N-acetyltransferase [Nocardiopsis chromatogenes]
MRMNWEITPMDVSGPEAVEVLRGYYRDIVTRYYGRPAAEADIDAAMKEEPSGALAPPSGLFLVARAPVGAEESVGAEGEEGAEGAEGRGPEGPVGCVGLKWFDGGAVAEIKRLFVHPRARGLGGGALLLEAAERAAKDGGATLVRLDTRSDLVEARRLYAANGYQEIAPFNDGPYADHWFAKHL